MVLDGTDRVTFFGRKNMSYGISIWDPRQLNRPLPASFQEAGEVLGHASSLSAKPNPAA